MKSVRRIAPVLIVVLAFYPFWSSTGGTPACYPIGQRPVSVSLRHGTVGEALTHITEQNGARLLVSEKVRDRPIVIDETGREQVVLQELCRAAGCHWKMEIYVVVWDGGEPAPEWQLSPEKPQ